MQKQEKGFSFNCHVTLLMKFQTHSLLKTFSLTDVSLKLSFIGIYFLSVLGKLLLIHH